MSVSVGGAQYLISYLGVLWVLRVLELFVPAGPMVQSHCRGPCWLMVQRLRSNQVAGYHMSYEHDINCLLAITKATELPSLNGVLFLSALGSSLIRSLTHLSRLEIPVEVTPVPQLVVHWAEVRWSMTAKPTTAKTRLGKV